MLEEKERGFLPKAVKALSFSFSFFQLKLIYMVLNSKCQKYFLWYFQ